MDRSPHQMRAFVEGVDQVAIAHLHRDGAYALIAVTPERVVYYASGRLPGESSCASPSALLLLRAGAQARGFTGTEPGRGVDAL